MKEVFKTNDGRRSIVVIDHDSKVMLQSVLIERQKDGTFKLVRSRLGGGEAFIASDLADAFAIVFAAYDSMGMPRSLLLSGQTGASATSHALGTYVDNAPELRKLTNPLTLADADADDAQCGAIAPGGECRCTLPLGHGGNHADGDWDWEPDIAQLSGAAKAMAANAGAKKVRAKRTTKKKRAKSKRRAKKAA